MPTIIHERVRLALAGKFPGAICRMPSGILVMGETQPVSGYCVLLANPVVPHLNAMSDEQGSTFLRDMARVGQVLMGLKQPLRINYEILGNVVPALHGHIIPRYSDEPDDKRLLSIFCGYQMGALPPTDLLVAKPFMESLRMELLRQNWAIS